MMIKGEPVIPPQGMEIAKKIAAAAVADVQRKLGLPKNRAGRLLANIIDQEYPLPIFKGSIS